jgi:glycosyltransferase involved in cell wall biosynthesis
MQDKDLMNKTLGIVSGMWISRNDQGAHIHVSFGRVIDALAKHFKAVNLCAPVSKAGLNRTRDYTIKANNLRIIPQPLWKSSISALLKLGGILPKLIEVVAASDVILIRGTMPYLLIVYVTSVILRKPIVHNIVGNPTGILRMGRRYNILMDAASLLYSIMDEKLIKLLAIASKATFIVHGNELYQKYKMPGTVEVVSSTICKDEFYYREDTCDKEKIRLLFVGFVRPEKGLVYLVQALSKLKTFRTVELVIVGPTDSHPSEFKRITKEIKQLDIEDKVYFEGYAAFGAELFGQLRRSDILVLPTLSEGTPRVLIEARAFGLPVISTNVGGIPSSVKDGIDGILVPPADSDALARAIDKVIDDDDLRNLLIRNGYERVKHLTIERFVDVLLKELNRKLK